MNDEPIFHRKLLNLYNVVPKEGVYKLKVANNVKSVYDNGETKPRYLVHLRAGLLENLIEATRVLDDNGGTCLYNNIKDCFFTGALWPNQLENLEDLPVKGEEVIATIAYVDGVLRCTNIALLPRQPLEFFDYTEHAELLTTYDKILKSTMT